VKATKIQLIRLRSGLSQSEFARQLGLNVRTLQDWEQGRRHPSAAAVALLRMAGRRKAASGKRPKYRGHGEPTLDIDLEFPSGKGHLPNRKGAKVVPIANHRGYGIGGDR